MTVPVLWVSRNPEILHRGYADQALLESVLSRELWRPPNALEFAHYEVRGEFAQLFGQENIPANSGAVIVIPFRHHIDHVAWLRNQLDELDWAVVILTSEEEWLGNWRALDTDPETRRLWVMQARPEHGDLSGLLPCGWYPGIRDTLRALGPQERKLAWFFAGQLTHTRRQECVEAINRTRPYYDHVMHCNDTYFDTATMPQATYYELLASSKIVPCPSGPVSLCTGRVEEALEAGCVPLVDMVKPVEPQFDYWEMVFPGHPFPRIYDWSTFPAVLAEELAAWPANANRCWSYWQLWKRRMSHHLDDDVRAVMASAS